MGKQVLVWGSALSLVVTMGACADALYPPADGRGADVGSSPDGEISGGREMGTPPGMDEDGGAPPPTDGTTPPRDATAGDAQPTPPDAAVGPGRDGAVEPDACVPQCDDRACGDNGCGAPCGQCGAGEACDDGVCVCVEDCGEEMCGDGRCGAGEDCDTCPADCGADPACAVDPCAQCGACGHLDCWLWYSPSNAARAGGHLPDFFDLFAQEQRWAAARQMNGVLLLKMITLRQLLEDDFIEALLVPRLNAWNMRLGFDVSGATWASCLANRDPRLEAEAAVIQRIIDAGGRVEYLGLQSVLSKPLPNPVPERLSHCGEYTMEERFDDVVWYTGEMKTRFPGIQVGLIDAMVAHGDDAVAAYGQLTQRLTAAGETMDFVLFDHPYDYGEREGATSWASLAVVETYVRNELGLPTGLFHVSSGGGRESEARFHEESLRTHDLYAAAGGRAEFHVVSSWFDNPESELPEDAAAPRFPLTKVLRDLGRRITETNTAPRGRFARVNDAGVAHGWALDDDTPLVSIRVAVYLDGPLGEGELVGHFDADVPRPDVNDATGVPGDHGFRIPLPEAARDGRPHSVFIYGIDSRAMGEPALIDGGPLMVPLDP